MLVKDVRFKYVFFREDNRVGGVFWPLTQHLKLDQVQRLGISQLYLIQNLITPSSLTGNHQNIPMEKLQVRPGNQDRESYARLYFANFTFFKDKNIQGVFFSFLPLKFLITPLIFNFLSF